MGQRRAFGPTRPGAAATPLLSGAAAHSSSLPHLGRHRPLRPSRSSRLPFSILIDSAAPAVSRPSPTDVRDPAVSFVFPGGSDGNQASLRAASSPHLIPTLEKIRVQEPPVLPSEPSRHPAATTSEHVKNDRRDIWPPPPSSAMAAQNISTATASSRL